MRLARWLLSSAAAVLLVACGGGGSDGGTPAPTSVTLQSTVKDGGANPVSGVTITVATQSTTVTRQTDALGAFTLTLNLSALPPASSGTDVLAVIAKDGYKTQVVTLHQAQLRQGGLLQLGQIALQALPSTMLAPAAGAVLTRLGDGLLSGNSSLNQFLQGAVVPGQHNYTIDMGDFSTLADPGTGAVSGTYPSLTLAGRFRGLQTDICPSQIEVYQLSGGTRTTLETFGGGFPRPLPSSAADGSLSPITLTGISTTLMNSANGHLWVDLRSGNCGTPTAVDYDDFEFVDLTVTFNTTP